MQFHEKALINRKNYNCFQENKLKKIKKNCSDRFEIFWIKTILMISWIYHIDSNFFMILVE